MRAVILAAGEGRRMRPLTSRRPKVMLPVAGRPLLVHLLERAVAAGIHDFTVVTHHQERAVKEGLRRHRVRGARVRFAHQKAPRGTGDALVAAAKGLDDAFVVLYGDTLPSVQDLRRLASGTGAAIGAATVADARAYGALAVKGTWLRRIAEKSARPPSRLVNAGVYRLPADVVAHARSARKSPRGEFELTDAVNAFVAAGGRVRVERLKAWMEAGRPWDLLGLQEALLRGLVAGGGGLIEKGVVVKGPVRLGAGTVIRSGTVLEGPIVIGERCRIGPNAYVRGATSIGNECHVGASVEVKNSILMERTNVPHLSYVGDSILGSDVNLGAGTSTANLKLTPRNVMATLEDGSRVDTGRRKFGAVVGDGTKVGINASLAPGTLIGTDCLIGMGKSVSGWVPAGTRLL